MRVCLDPQALNRAMKREVYPLPVIDEVLPELDNAKVFTKVDLQSCYWHYTLDEDSSNMTTFVTPFGRYKWMRLPSGLNVSSEIFQKRPNTALERLEGVMCVAYDMIVYAQVMTNTTRYRRSRQEAARIAAEMSEERHTSEQKQMPVSYQ